MSRKGLSTARIVAGLSDLELANIQMRLEYDLTPLGRLLRKGESTQNARFVAYKFKSGFAYFYRSDLSTRVLRALSSLPVEIALDDSTVVHTILDRSPLPKKTWAGSSYVFDHWPEAPLLNRVKFEDGRYQIEEGSEILSVATTARCDQSAAELIVETIEQARRRGYGRAVTCAWAQFYLEARKVPFFSHVLRNLPSRALARSLKLRKFCTVIAYD